MDKVPATFHVKVRKINAQMLFNVHQEVFSHPSTSVAPLSPPNRKSNRIEVLETQAG